MLLIKTCARLFIEVISQISQSPGAQLMLLPLYILRQPQRQPLLIAAAEVTLYRAPFLYGTHRNVAGWEVNG